MRTFSIGFDHQEFDELPHARRVAQLFGTVHEEFQVRAEAVEIVPKIVRHYGEPFADPSAIPSFYLAELTRRHVTVALNGDGGDESFGGYTRYVANALAGRLDRDARAPCAARSSPAAARPPGGRRRAQRRAAAPAASAARLRSTPRPLRELHVVVRPRSAPARSTRPSSRPGAGTAPHDAIAASWAATSGASVVDKMLEVDVNDLSRRRPDRQDRHRDDGLRARGALAVPRPRADAARRVDPRRAQGPRLGEEVDPARGAARLAARRPARPPQAGLHRPALELAADRPALVGARRAARPRDARPRLLPPRGGRRGCSTATRRARTTTTSGSGRC